MPRTPVQTFEDNIGYARGLIEGGRSLERLQVSVLDPADLYRAAWTQSVSALDHWLHAEIYARTPGIVNTVGGRRPQMLKKVKLSFEVIEQIHHQGLSLSDAFRTQIAEEIGRASFHQIRDLVRGMQYLVPSTADEVQVRLAAALNVADGDPVPPWSPKAIEARHRTVLDRRNSIAHEADLDPRTGARRALDGREAAGAVSWIDQLGHALRSLLSQ